MISLTCQTNIVTCHSDGKMTSSGSHSDVTVIALTVVRMAQWRSPDVFGCHSNSIYCHYETGVKTAGMPISHTTRLHVLPKTHHSASPGTIGRSQTLSAVTIYNEIRPGAVQVYPEAAGQSQQKSLLRSSRTVRNTFVSTPVRSNAHMNANTQCSQCMRAVKYS